MPKLVNLVTFCGRSLYFSYGHWDEQLVKTASFSTSTFTAFGSIETTM